MESIRFLKSKLIWSIFLIILSSAQYICIGYIISREEHLSLGLCVTGLFLSYYVLLKHNFHTSYLIALGLLFRILFLWATPNLSQDFYRFFWDSRLILEGLNPYLWTPNELINSYGLTVSYVEQLWNGMGPLSQSNFSNYPPIHILPSVLTTLVFQESLIGNIVLLRLFLIAVDVGILIFGQKLLQTLNLSTKNILFYFLNPLVIIELSGNLHHEGLMILFLVVSFYFLQRKKLFFSGLFMGLSILTKLITFLFLPLLIYHIGFKKGLQYYGTIVLVVLLGFLPFTELNFIVNYTQTIGLWFSNFEFNASLFYLAKTFFSHFFGLHLMHYMSFINPTLMGILLAYLLTKKEVVQTKIYKHMLFLLFGYLLLSTTIHPWYIITLIFLSCLTNYRFPLWWSFSVFLSYFSYHNGFVLEHNFWRFIQYGLVLVIVCYEIIKFQKITASSTG